MFDHASIGVTDLARSLRSYDAALGAPGHARLGGNARSGTYGSPSFVGEAPLGVILQPAAAPVVGHHLAAVARSSRPPTASVR